MQQNFRTRITLINTVTVALLMALVFCIIYAVVHYTSYKHLDDDIIGERNEVFNNLDWTGDSIIIRKMPEWNEAEHKQMEANPTFLQLVDIKDSAIFKSDNLKGEHFLFNPNGETETFYNDIVHNQRLRLGQFPVKNDEGKIIGHLTIGVSQQESFIVLHNLMLVLIISFVFLLLTLFGVLWYAASQAIKPVNDLIYSAASINENNLNERLPLPKKKDEIWKLAQTFNELLNRLENSIQQQKQFTADVSHEMRTPLTAIKGTLEVLLRKPRSTEQYETKLADVLHQTNRLTRLYDEMLELAKIESSAISVNKKNILLKPIINDCVRDFSTEINNAAQQILVTLDGDAMVNADAVLLERIVTNIISNAIKYNKPGGNIFIVWKPSTQSLSITDEGNGISETQLPNIFNRFYRTDESRTSDRQGNGIGLFIVKKLCDLQGIGIMVKSESGKGSTFELHF